MAKKINFRSLNKGELDKKLTDLREEIRLTHFKSEGARPKNVKHLLNLRRDIARILTVMNESK